MSEDQPKVSKLAAGGWMITQKPKSITVSWKSPAHLWMRVASTLWKPWALQAVSTILPRNPVLVGQHFILQGPGSQRVDGWLCGVLGVLFLPLSVNDSDSVFTFSLGAGL